MQGWEIGLCGNLLGGLFLGGGAAVGCGRGWAALLEVAAEDAPHGGQQLPPASDVEGPAVAQEGGRQEAVHVGGRR